MKKRIPDGVIVELSIEYRGKIMRCYIVDELSSETVRHLAEAMESRGWASGIERLYWLPLAEKELNPIQREHAISCGPHCMALELLDNGVRLELLIRARGKMRCECVAYACPETEQAMMEQVDTLIGAIQDEEINQVFGVMC